MNTLSVFIYASITAICTGLGAFPFYIIKKPSKKWLGIFNGVAAGLMLAASWSLIFEALQYSLFMNSVGMLAGLAFVIGSKKILDKHHDSLSFHNLDKADASKIIIFLAIMTVHSFTEGVGVGVSFSGSEKLGAFITTAIAIHNIPEGLAIALIMIPRGTSVTKAALWAVFSSLPQPIMAIPAFLFVEVFKDYLAAGLGFAAGAMIWMVVSEIIPDALEDADSSTVASSVTISVICMLIFQSII